MLKIFQRPNEKIVLESEFSKQKFRIEWLTLIKSYMSKVSVWLNI